MAERKTGRRRGSNPVKPRTIDLKAEKVENKPDDTPAKKPADAASGAAAAKPASSAAKPDETKPAAAAASSSAAQSKSAASASPPKDDTPKAAAATKPATSSTSTPHKDSTPKRSAASDAGARAQSSSSSVPPRKPDAASDTSGGGIGGYALAGLLGGVIAVGAYYGLSSMDGDAGDVSGDLVARLEAIETQQSAAAEQRAQLEQQLADAQAAAGVNPEELSALREAIDSYQSAAASRQEAVSQQIADLVAANEAMRGRLDTIAAGDGAASGEALAGMQQAVAALQADLEALKAAPGSDAALGEVNQRLDALGARIGETETGLAQARDASAAIQQQMAQLAEQVASAGGAQDAAQQAAVALALSDLRAAVNRGGSFTAELEALTALLPAAGEGDALAAAAAEGVATRRELEEGFDAVIRDVLAAADSNPEAGFFAKLFDNATSIVTVRPIGALAGDEPQAVVARIETQLDDGALVEALAEWQKLPPQAQQAGAQWAQALERKVSVERKLDEIGRGVLSGLGQAS